MKLLVQKTSRAKVTVENKVVGEIGHGLLVFLGVHREDDETKIPWLVDKVTNLRIFEDQAGKMNLSVRDVEGSILLVSQFTLYGNCQTGRRPSFIESMPPNEAKQLYKALILQLQESMGEKHVVTGEFGAMMEVELTNSGPVTLMLER